MISPFSWVRQKLQHRASRRGFCNAWAQHHQVRAQWKDICLYNPYQTLPALMKTLQTHAGLDRYEVGMRDPEMIGVGGITEREGVNSSNMVLYEDFEPFTPAHEAVHVIQNFKQVVWSQVGSLQARQLVVLLEIKHDVGLCLSSQEFGDPNESFCLEEILESLKATWKPLVRKVFLDNPLLITPEAVDGVRNYLLAEREAYGLVAQNARRLKLDPDDQRKAVALHAQWRAFSQVVRQVLWEMPGLQNKSKGA